MSRDEGLWNDDKFRVKALSRLARAEHNIKPYKFLEMRRMLQVRSAREIADFIVESVKKNETSYGLERLCESGQLDDSIEKLIIEIGSPFFSVHHIAACQASLFLVSNGQ